VVSVSASIAFVCPESGPVDESAPAAETVPEILLSALRQSATSRASTATQARVVLRLGALYGPSIGRETPAARWAACGATLRIEDAGRAIAAAAEVPGGVYNVSDGERVSKGDSR
jgi:nucleoside-diphosphate-sugar epimerase